MSGDGNNFPWWVKVVIGVVILVCAGLALKFAYDHVIRPTTTTISN